MKMAYTGLVFDHSPARPACRSWVDTALEGLCMGLFCAIVLMGIMWGISSAQAADKPPEAPAAAEFYVTFEGDESLYCEDTDAGLWWVYDESTLTWEVCARPLGQGKRVRVHGSGRVQLYGEG